MGRFTDRIAHAWNAFVNQDGENRSASHFEDGPGYGNRPDRTRMRISNGERTIITSIYNRLAIDVAAVGIRHVRLDEQERFLEIINSGLNQCLTVEANIDQAATAFRQDIAQTLCEKGTIAIVPVDTTIDPNVTGSYDIKTMRVGEIVTWYPKRVRVKLWNEDKGLHQEVTIDKTACAIVENPLYAVMNEPNSTLQRLIRKLGLLDVVDEASSSGKLDLIIQLPYVIKSDARREQAEQRRKDIEFQLKSSTYGVAYTDGTEKITQLNRPAENNMLKQVEYLTAMLYGQLGLTEEIMNGTADEKTMINYQNRSVLPIVEAIVEAMRRTFLTKTARSQMQSIIWLRDPFRFAPIADIAEMADKFARNEILSSNEIRSVIGFKPAKDKNADKLQNSNMPQANPAAPPGQKGELPQKPEVAPKDQTAAKAVNTK